MKPSLKITTAAAFALAALGAHAQSTQPSTPFYGSIGYEAIGITATGSNGTAKADPGVLMGTIGYQLHPNLAVEGVVGGTVRDDDVRINGAGTGIEGSIDSTYGVLVKK